MKVRIEIEVTDLQARAIRTETGYLATAAVKAHVRKIYLRHGALALDELIKTTKVGS